MPSAFVPLRAFLSRASASVPEPEISVPCESTDTIEAVAVGERGERERALLRDVKLAHAALADALDVALADLMCDIASDVLGRDLFIAPADIQAIVASGLERAREQSPVAIRVHPDEVSQLQALDVPVVADERLRRGDAMIDVKSGTIDMSLGVRLAAVLHE